MCAAPRGSVSYFEAYEILLDELRDYRWYMADMLHPSQLAVEFIFQVSARNHAGLHDRWRSECACTLAAQRLLESFFDQADGELRSQVQVLVLLHEGCMHELTHPLAPFLPHRGFELPPHIA